jgi:hypothetical protein
MPELRRWTNRHHEEWVCGAYDHGPMCRLCRRVDPTLALVLENLDKGYVEYVNVDQDGEPQFRVTPAGQDRVARLIGGEVGR